MIRALLYLQSVSIANAVRRWLQRLRQPRYAVAMLVGAAYFYFLFFRPATTMGRGFGGRYPSGETSAAVGVVASVGVLVLLLAGRLVYAWIFSKDRASLAFTEAEVVFLFPAPVTRQTLVHFKLLKSQVRILIYAVLLGLLSGDVAFLGGNAWTHAVGWWILFSTLELHGIAASFTRDRLLNLGLNPARRRLLLGGALAAVVLLLVWGVRRFVPAPTPADLAGTTALLHYVRTVVTVPPLSWAVAPFRWVLGPFFAPAGAAFWLALGPALAVVAAHYVWVLRSEVAFEEASVELARRHAERVAAVKAGGLRGMRQPGRRRNPFPLRPRGFAPVAFVWRNLIAAGPWFYPRTWLWIAGGLLGVTAWLVATPSHRPWLAVAQSVVPMVGAWVLFFVPMFMRRQVQLLIERLDVVKTYPLRGWQIVLGEVLAPVLMITTIEWLILAVFATIYGALARNLVHASLLTALGALEIGLLVPPVAGLMIALPFVATLYFPGWMSAVNNNRGIDAMGQRLIFVAGFLIALLLALLPAVLVGAVPFLIVRTLTGVGSVALVAGSVTTGTVLAGEFAGMIWWLGRRYERFDLSVELPRT